MAPLSMLKGFIAEMTHGLRYPGLTEHEFKPEQIAALGKLTQCNDFVTRYMVRLHDQTVVFVNVNAQPAEVRGRLYRIGREIRTRRPKDGQLEFWKDLT